MNAQQYLHHPKWRIRVINKSLLSWRQFWGARCYAAFHPESPFCKEKVNSLSFCFHSPPTFLSWKQALQASESSHFLLKGCSRCSELSQLFGVFLFWFAISAGCRAVWWGVFSIRKFGRRHCVRVQGSSPFLLHSHLRTQGHLNHV